MRGKCCGAAGHEVKAPQEGGGPHEESAAGGLRGVRGTGSGVRMDVVERTGRGWT